MSRPADTIVRALAPHIGYRYVRLLRATMRLEYRHREVLAETRDAFGPYLLTLWHSRFVMMPYVYDGPRLTVLASEHRDSRMLAEILQRLGVEPIWGSSTSGGARGLRNVVRRAQAGADVAITPDGPKGPRRRVKPGVITAARLGGMPIVPVTFSARPARRLRSWDRTLLPLPFARGVYVCGRPVRVPRYADAARCEQLRLDVERELDRITDEADELTGIGREPARPAADARAAG